MYNLSPHKERHSISLCMQVDTINVFGLLLVYLSSSDILSLRFICQAFLLSFKVQFREAMEALGETKLIASFYRMSPLSSLSFIDLIIYFLPFILSSPLLKTPGVLLVYLTPLPFHSHLSLPRDHILSPLFFTPSYSILKHIQGRKDSTIMITCYWKKLPRRDTCASLAPSYAMESSALA